MSVVGTLFVVVSDVVVGLPSFFLQEIQYIQVGERKSTVQKMNNTFFYILKIYFLVLLAQLSNLVSFLKAS